MMEKELINRCNRLKLLMGKESVAIRVQARNEGGSSTGEKFMLVASLLSMCPFNYKALERTMLNM